MNSYWTQIEEKAAELGIGSLEVHNRGLVSTANRCDDCGRVIDKPAALCASCVQGRSVSKAARDPINIARRQGCLIVINDGKSKMDRNISRDFDTNDAYSPCNAGL